MRNQVFKKLFSVLLALIMVAGLLPASAMAGGWGAMDVDTTPELTETEQPAEPTPGQGEPVAEPTPEQVEPTAEPVPTQGEPTAEPTDEGIMPANVMPVQANVAARDTSGDDYYRIVHLDCGRKYFDVSYIKGIIDAMYLNGYNQLQLAFGNGGLRFVLDGMPHDLKDAIAQGNKNFHDSTTNELTQAEMTEIISYAKGKNIEIVPLLNMPGHMDGILSSNKYSGYKLSGSEGSLDLNNENAVAFGKELLSMYVEYFKTQGCKFFNFGADEYGQDIWNPYIESSVAQVNYKQLIDYMNACAEIIENAGMTARCFNDFVCYNNRTSCDLKKSVQVCYWSNQWNGSEYNTVDVINNAGYKLINTNQKWYFVPSKAEEYSKATVLANFKTFDVTKFQHITSGYNSSSTTYYEISGGNNVGAMFCVWCDKPSVAVDLSDVKELIAAMADANPTYFTKVTIPNTTVGNATTADNDTVRVTGPNLAALKCETATVTIQGAAEGKIAAYDVTPSTKDSTNYTGNAEVRIKIPEGWDKTKVKAFIVENGTAKDIVDGTATEDGWYMFTAPHFSVMGIYEKAVTYVEKTVTVAVGDSETVTVDGTQGEEVENKELRAEDGTTVVANYKVEHVSKTGGTTQTVTDEKKLSNLGTGETADVLIGDWQDQDDPKLPLNYMVVANGTISRTTNVNDATVFTVTKVNNYYTIKVKDDNKYIIRNNNNTLSIGASANQNNSWSVGSGNDLCYQQGYNIYYYLTYSDNQWGVSNSISDWKTVAHPYSFNTTTTPAEEKTEITFTGVAVGTTSVVIGGTRYTVKVVDATLENAEKLYIDFWVTNHRIEPTGLAYKTTSSLDGTTSVADGRNYATFTAGDFYVEEGKLLSDVIPKTGYAPVEGVAALYWKVRYLPHDQRQDRSGWTNKSGYGTDTITGVNGGVDIERIRFYGGKWEYRAVGATDWTAFSGTTADESGNQIVAYYLLKTEVTDEVTTYITDWPDPNNIKNIFGVALDYCVKYESNGTRNPNVFGRKYKSQWFNCQGDGAAVTNGYTLDSTIVNIDSSWEGPEGSKYYRVINNIRGEETADYEIYMITITPSTAYFGNDTTYYECPETITYSTEKGAEKVIWAESQDTVDMSGLTQHSELVIGGTPDVKRVLIRRGTGMLITYYVRAKVTEDALTVHYINMKNNDQEFYTYNIAVGKGTLFPENPEHYFGNGVLSNYSVQNKEGNTETIKSDLKELPKIAAQYRYSKFVCVKVKRSEDGKDFYLYYTFDNEVTFVVDFGLPIKVTPIDVNTSLEGKAERVEVTQKDVKYGTVAIEENSVNFTYTLNKMINGYDTIVATYYGTGIDGNEGEVSFNIHIIPATNVYYEDSFAKFNHGAGAAEGAKWTAAGKAVNDSPNQALEALGNKTNVYGYDHEYQNSTMFSMGSAQKVTVTQAMVDDWNKHNDSAWPTAQFTFKGTGFDIISLTDNTSGAIFVDVYKGNSNSGEREKGHVVNNYYGYTYSEEKGWEINNNPNAIYQVPVIKVSGLTYGEHTVVIKVCYDKIFDVADGKKYSFWLDAVRVYNPAGSDLDKDYVKDREVRPIYVEVRKALIGQGGFTAVGSGLTNGAVFIDGKAEGATIDDYKNFGPNHEVYLAGNQAIAFRIVADRKPDTVQIGVKLANGSSGTLKIGGGNEVKFAAYSNGNASEVLTLSTATDMYYALNGITWTQEENGSQKSNVIVLTNTGDNSIVSITNVKCTYASVEENTTNTVTLAISYDDALMAVDMVNNAITPIEPEPEPEPEPEKTFEPERFEASWSRNVMQGRKATLTVKTSEDVEAITVDGQTIRSYRTRTERVGFGRRAKRITYREFTYSMVAQESADFSVTAINAEGTESEAITARLTVKTRPNSMRDMWDWFKGWF